MALTTDDHPPRFAHSFVDASGGFDGWGAMAVADFDGDGRSEFVTGGKGGGFYFLYDLDPASMQWTRHTITHAFSPHVGATAPDLDRDGRPEIVCGEWGPRLLWLRRLGESLGDWTIREVHHGLRDPHDILCGDVNGDGRIEIVVREKDRRLIVLYPSENLDTSRPWEAQVVADEVPGDGTVLVPREEHNPRAGMDIVTNCGWFTNLGGDRPRFDLRPIVPAGLDWHHETRIAVADIDGDGRREIVLTESEIRDARLAILRPGPAAEGDRVELLFSPADRVGGLHSLIVQDIDGDGRTEIITVEMENQRTDGIERRPRWWCFRPTARGWSRWTLLDANLGGHGVACGDFDGDGRLDLVGKEWRANAVNGNGGRNHVDFLRQLVPGP